MDCKQLIELHKILNDQSTELMARKNAEYAKDGDALNNFREVSKRTGITPQQAWLVHFLKQVSAIESYVRGNRNITDSLQSRLLDIRNYTTFLAAIEEEESDDHPTLPTTGSEVADKPIAWSIKAPHSSATTLNGKTIQMKYDSDFVDDSMDVPNLDKSQQTPTLSVQTIAPPPAIVVSCEGCGHELSWSYRVEKDGLKWLCSACEGNRKETK